MEIQQVQPTNPLLEKLRIPGTTFRLPSQGIFYGEGVLDQSVRNGEVEVYPMTAMDEIIFATPDKLLSGKAISEVFSRCIPQVKNPLALLAKDVDFLMVCLRMVSFGQFMPVTYKHTCENAKEHEYNIDLDALIKASKQIDPTSIASEYTSVLPNGQTVSLKPLTYADIVELYQTTLMMKSDQLTDEDAERLIVSTISSIIANVDGITDKTMIIEWVKKVPLGWKKQVEQAAQEVTQWGVDFTVKRKCQDCKEVTDITVTANPVSFFT